MDAGQKVMIGIVLLVVLVGGYFVFRPAGDDVQTQDMRSATPYAAAVTPVNDGGNVYTIDGLGWVFEPQTIDESGAPTTRVRLRLEGFKRSGVPIDVALYRLGTYRGECQVFDAAKGEPVPPAEHALSFAQCWWQDGGRQLGVYQEGDNLVVKVRSVSAVSSDLEGMVPILTIDIAKVVQPL